ncbi:MAG: hypothetical protein AAFY57_15635 [Cyanobacteria bacterium J06642_2]
MGLPQRQPDWYEVPAPTRRVPAHRKRSRFHTQRDLAPVVAVPPQSVPSGWRVTMEVLRTTTGILAVLSTVVVLGLYGSNVRAQSHWNQQYRELERLKQAESQYELDRESIVNSLRVTLEHSNLVPLAPERLIQLPAAPARPAPVEAQLDQKGDRSFMPRGY